jgi:triacylglycerol lipase
MGGLVSRTWLTLLCPPGRCRRFIAISAPHRGTLWARFSLRKQGVKDMRPQSRLIRNLTEGKIQADQVYCYRTPYDLMIMPSRPSGIPGAIERSFFAPSHRRMISQTSVLRSLIEDLHT